MYISSRTNPRVIAASKLKSKKYRDENGLFAFEGIKLFNEAVKRKAELVEVYLTESASLRVDLSLLPDECEAHTVADSVYAKLTDDRAPDGVFCVARIPAEPDAQCELKPKAMILCDIQDAGNLGTCIRSSLAFGIDTLILCGECADTYNPKCIRSSMGGIFSQRIVKIPDRLRAITACRKNGLRVYAAALNRSAVPLDSFPLSSDVVFAVGNEGHGLPEDFIEACDGCVIIPMKGDTESLNAAIASSVLMWNMRNVE